MRKNLRIFSYNQLRSINQITSHGEKKKIYIYNIEKIREILENFADKQTNASMQSRTEECTVHSKTSAMNKSTRRYYVPPIKENFSY